MLKISKICLRKLCLAFLMVFAWAILEILYMYCAGHIVLSDILEIYDAGHMFGPLQSQEISDIVETNGLHHRFLRFLRFVGPAVAQAYGLHHRFLRFV
jgi:hypothetical protein